MIKNNQIRFLYLILLLIIIQSCAQKGRRYFFVNELNFQTTKLDEGFKKKSQSYGAYYNRYYTSVEHAFSLTIYTYHRQLVILNKSGYEYAKIYIPISDRIENVKITTFNPSTNTLNEVDLSSMIKIEQVKENDYIESESYYAYSIPNVTDGLIIDYSFEVQYDYLIPYDNLNLMAELPIKELELQYIFPDVFEYQIFNYNHTIEPIVDKFSIDERSRTTYRNSNVLPIESEPYSGPPQLLIPRTEFIVYKIKYSGSYVRDVFTNWNAVGITYLSKILSTTNVDSVNSLILNTSQTLKSRMDSIEAIINYVHNNFKIKRNIDRKFNQPENVLKEGYGSELGIKSLAYRLLEASNFKSEIVLVKSFERGKLDFDNPTPAEIDDVFLRVDYFLYDPTSPSIPLGKLPYHYQNTNCIIISDFQASVGQIKGWGFNRKYLSSYQFEVGLASINPIKWNSSQHRIKIKLDLNSIQNIDMSMTYKGNHAYQAIEKFNVYNKYLIQNYDQKDEIQNYLNSIFNDTKLNNYEIKVSNEKKKELKLDLNISNSSVVENFDSEYIVNIGSFIPNEYLILLNEEDRTLDYNFEFGRIRSITFEIIHPEGYKLVMPENRINKIDNEFFYQRLIKTADEDKSILYFDYAIKKRIVGHQVQSKVQEFIQQINDVKSIQLLLTKSD